MKPLKFNFGRSRLVIVPIIWLPVLLVALVILATWVLKPLGLIAAGLALLWLSRWGKPNA